MQGQRSGTRLPFLKKSPVPAALCPEKRTESGVSCGYHKEKELTLMTTSSAIAIAVCVTYTFARLLELLEQGGRRHN